MSEVSCKRADESSRSRSESLDFCSRMAFNSMIDENSFVIIWSFRRKVLYLWPNRAWSRSFYRGAGSFFNIPALHVCMGAVHYTLFSARYAMQYLCFLLYTKKISFPKNNLYAVSTNPFGFYLGW